MTSTKKQIKKSRKSIKRGGGFFDMFWGSKKPEQQIIEPVPQPPTIEPAPQPPVVEPVVELVQQPPAVEPLKGGRRKKNGTRKTKKSKK